MSWIPCDVAAPIVLHDVLLIVVLVHEVKDIARSIAVACRNPLLVTGEHGLHGRAEQKRPFCLHEGQKTKYAKIKSLCTIDYAVSTLLHTLVAIPPDKVCNRFSVLQADNLKSLYGWSDSSTSD